MRKPRTKQSQQYCDMQGLLHDAAVDYSKTHVIQKQSVLLCTLAFFLHALFFLHASLFNSYVFHIPGRGLCTMC